MSNVKKQKSKARKIVDGIFIIVFVILCVLLVFVGVSVARGKTPSFFGYSILNVKTESMEPNIPKGAIILVKNVDIDDVKDIEVGEIVVFKSEIKGIPVTVTHRVIENNQEDCYLITQGDANASDDGEIEYSRVVAKYCFKFTILTFLYKVLSSFWGFLVLIILPSLALLISYIISMAKASVALKTAQEESADNEKIEELKKQAIEEYLKNNQPPNNEEK